MAELTSKKSKTKKVMSDLLSKTQSKFNTNVDGDDENVRIRTDEVSQNALTGLFLVLKKGQWDDFPMTMKLLWLFCIVMGSGIQWITLLLLFLYTRDQEVDPLSADTGGQAVALMSVMVSSLILFIYVLAEFRRAAFTLYQYWGIFINSVKIECKWDNFLHLFVLIFLMGDVGILATTAFLSSMSINQQNNISDQLGIALSYFFLLEVDEWIYIAVIEDFDVLEDEDFVLTSKDLMKADSDQEFYKKKARNGILWTIVLVLLTIFSAVTWYYFASINDE